MLDDGLIQSVVINMPTDPLYRWLMVLIPEAPSLFQGILCPWLLSTKRLTMSKCAEYYKSFTLILQQLML